MAQGGKSQVVNEVPSQDQAPRLTQEPPTQGPCPTSCQAAPRGPSCSCITSKLLSVHFCTRQGPLQAAPRSSFGEHDWCGWPTIPEMLTCAGHHSQDLQAHIGSCLDDLRPTEQRVPLVLLWRVDGAGARRAFWQRGLHHRDTFSCGAKPELVTPIEWRQAGAQPFLPLPPAHQSACSH